MLVHSGSVWLKPNLNHYLFYGLTRKNRMRNLWGIFAAAAFLVLPEALRFVGMPSSITANMRQTFYGLALILVVFRSAYSSKKETAPASGST
jgi:hypothetical protein